MNFTRAVPLALLGATLAVSAQANTPHIPHTPDITVLHFPLLHLPLPLPFFPDSDLSYDNTVGGQLTVSAGGGELAFSLLGELGVSSGNLLNAIDIALGKNEQITFSFETPVSLLYWDLDDANPLVILPDGTNQFSLAVDGGLAQSFSLRSHLPGSALIGTTFTFGYAGDGYFLDTLKFAAPVPEMGTLAQLGLGLGMLGWLANRRRGM